MPDYKKYRFSPDGHGGYAVSGSELPEVDDNSTKRPELSDLPTYSSDKRIRVRIKKRTIILLVLLAALAAAVVLKWDVVSTAGHRLFQNRTLNNLNTAAVIPDDALQYDDHFYYVYDDADSWADAENLCEKRGGHLVTITSQAENDFVCGILGKEGCEKAYIGLYNRSYNDSQDWTWVTGESISTMAWGSGEPNNDNGGIEFYCELTATGSWNDCLLESGDGSFICEWDTDTPEPCDNSVLEFGGHYYQMFSDATGWKDAKERAAAKGGYLACISGAEENAALLQLARRSGCNEAFFGLFQSGQNGSVYVFTWVDGEGASYSDWQEGQPDCCNGNEFYGQFGLGSGHWNDIDEDGTGTYIVEWDSQDAMK